MTETNDNLTEAVLELVSVFRQLLGSTEALEGSTVQAPDEWLDVGTISVRLNRPKDSIRWAARNAGIGKRERGRWLISLQLAKEYYSKPTSR